MEVACHAPGQRLDWTGHVLSAVNNARHDSQWLPNSGCSAKLSANGLPCAVRWRKGLGVWGGVGMRRVNGLLFSRVPVPTLGLSSGPLPALYLVRANWLASP